MDENYIPPTLKAALTFSPTFFHMLEGYFGKYRTYMIKFEGLLPMFQQYQQKLNQLKMDIIYQSEHLSNVSVLNPINQPLVDDLVLKFIKSCHDDSHASTMEKIERTSIGIIRQQIENFQDLKRVKTEFEDGHEKFFHYLTNTSKTSMEPYEVWLARYQLLLLKFAFQLRKNARCLDESLYRAIHHYFREALALNLGFSQLPNGDSSEIPSSLDFILTSNQDETKADQAFLESTVKELETVIKDYALNDDPLEENYFHQTESVGPESDTHDDKNEKGKKKSYFNMIMSKKLSFPTIINQMSRVVKPAESNLLLNMDTFMVRSSPQYLDTLKFMNQPVDLSVKDHYQLEGYLLVSKPESLDFQLTFVRLDKKEGLLYAQGYDDVTVTPLAYLCHCLLIYDKKDSSSFFEITSQRCFHIFVNAFSPQNQKKWVKDIQESIDEQLMKVKYKIVDLHLSYNGHDCYKTPQSVIYSQSANRFCADCGAEDPVWVNYHQGVTLCSECAGAHRSYGSHQNHVRSLLHDFWNDTNFEHVLSLGNESVNSTLQANLPEEEKIKTDSSMENRIAFVGKKYQKKLFV